MMSFLFTRHTGSICTTSQLLVIWLYITRSTSRCTRSVLPEDYTFNLRRRVFKSPEILDKLPNSQNARVRKPFGQLVNRRTTKAIYSMKEYENEYFKLKIKKLKIEIELLEKKWRRKQQLTKSQKEKAIADENLRKQEEENKAIKRKLEEQEAENKRKEDEQKRFIEAIYSMKEYEKEYFKLKIKKLKIEIELLEKKWRRKQSFSESDSDDDEDDDDDE